LYSVVFFANTDLSKKVAAAWHSCDDEVKLFCAEVSDLTLQEYKKALYRQQKDDIKSEEEDDSSTESKATELTQKNKRNDKKQQSSKKKEQQHKPLRPSKVDDSSTAVEEVLSCSQPVANASMSKTANSGAAVVPTPWSSVGQLSLPLPSYSYQNNYPPACQADVDDQAIWKMWMSCD
jgi:hypothetical protein